MKKTMWIGAAALAAVGVAAGRGLAQESDAPKGFGLQKSHLTEDLFEMSVGVTSAGRPRTPERLTETRVHTAVPSHYGDLFQITMRGDDAVLWYRASDGTIRNAVLEAASSVPYAVEQHDTTHFESKLR